MAVQVLTQAVSETCRDTVPEKEDADIVPTSPAVSETEVDELLSLYDAIQKRKGKQIYPLVLPAEVASDGLQREFADEQYALVRDLEAVQFQSFLDNCYEVFRVHLPADPEISESVRHALWARENYYLCSKQFFINQSFASKVMAHRWDAEKFLPLLAVASIEDDEERQVAAAICKRMQQQWITAFDSVLWARWGKIEKRKCVKELQARFWTFIQEEYFVVLAEVVETKVTEADAEASLEQAFKHKVLALWEEERSKSAFLPAAVPEEFTHVKMQELRLAQQSSLGGVVETEGEMEAADEQALEARVLVLWDAERSKSSYLPKQVPDEFRRNALVQLRESMKGTFPEGSTSPLVDAALEQKVITLWEEERAKSRFLPSVVPLEFMRAKMQELTHQVCSGEVVDGKGGAHVESDLALEKEVLALWEKEKLKSKHLPKEFPKDFRTQALRELRQGRKRTSAEAFVSPVPDAILEQQVLALWQVERNKSAYIPVAVPQEFMQVKKQELANAHVGGFGSVPALQVQSRSVGEPEDGSLAKRLSCIPAEERSTAMSILAVPSPESPPKSLTPVCLSEASPQRIQFGMDSLRSSCAGSPSSGPSSPIQLREPEVISAYQILDQASTSNRYNFEGSVLEFDRQPRQVMTKSKRRGSEDAGSLVINAILFDSTGPVTVTLWGDSCTAFLEAMRAPQVDAIISLSSLRVVALPRNEWNGTFLTPFRKLQSVESIGHQAGTQVKLVSEATSPFLKDVLYEAPGFPLCISDFRVASSKMVAPFRGTFQGIIFDVGFSDTTQQGEPKAEFKMMDPSGAWVQCCALGKHASNAMLEACVEAVVYFATGRGPIGGTEGMIYVMKDAAIVPLTRHRAIPTKSINIPILNRQE